jgi:hypothetical protein
MRTTAFCVVALAAALLQPGHLEAQRTLHGGYDLRDDRVGRDSWDRRFDDIDARIWVEGDRGYFSRGDRMRVRFQTTADAYVAVLHIDPDGALEVVYPRSPWDDGFVRAGRSYSVQSRSSALGFAVHGSPGIGYWYVLASTVPLDYRAFSGHQASRWDLGGYGGYVRGDPFYALDHLARVLLPDWRYVPHAVDVYSYSVGGRHRYPTYACYDSRYGGSLAGWNPYYTDCSRVHHLLIMQPYYYDTRRYRGDRVTYLRRVGPTAGYQYKEPALPSGSRAVQPRELRPQSTQAAPRTGVAAPQRPTERRPEAAPAGTGSPRPTLERRPEPRRSPEPSAQPAPQRRPEAQRPERQEPRQQPSAAPAPARRPEVQRPERRQPQAEPQPQTRSRERSQPQERPAARPQQAQTRREAPRERPQSAPARSAERPESGRPQG